MPISHHTSPPLSHYANWWLFLFLSATIMPMGHYSHWLYALLSQLLSHFGLFFCFWRHWCANFFTSCRIRSQRMYWTKIITSSTLSPFGNLHQWSFLLSHLKCWVKFRFEWKIFIKNPHLAQICHSLYCNVKISEINHQFTLKMCFNILFLLLLIDSINSENKSTWTQLV